jgi:hypothetical protein
MPKSLAYGIDIVEVKKCTTLKNIVHNDVHTRVPWNVFSP